MDNQIRGKVIGVKKHVPVTIAGIGRYVDIPASYKPSNNNSSSSSGTGNHSHSSGSNSSSKTDPYNAKDYANEEDFYEDHYNDFIDFDEAEQYWEDNN